MDAAPSLSMSLSSPSLSLSPPSPSPSPTSSSASQAAEGAASIGSQADKRAAIAATAHTFEASFLSVMFGQMFEGVQTAAPFGGGEGEGAFRSFLTDAMGRAVARRGGVGLSKAVATEMLKMQGLS